MERLLLVRPQVVSMRESNAEERMRNSLKTLANPVAHQRNANAGLATEDSYATEQVRMTTSGSYRFVPDHVSAFFRPALIYRQTWS